MVCTITKIFLLESLTYVHVMAVIFGHRIVSSNGMSKTSKFQLIMKYKEEKENILFLYSLVKSKSCVYLSDCKMSALLEIREIRKTSWISKHTRESCKSWGF